MYVMLWKPILNLFHLDAGVKSRTGDYPAGIDFQENTV